LILGASSLASWVIDGQLARGQRPGRKHGGPVSTSTIDDWLEKHRAMGIRSIICLLHDDQLKLYDDTPGGLLTRYKEAGFELEHVPAYDYQHPPLTQKHLKDIWRAYQSLPKPILVHCSAGVDRTGLAVNYIRKQLDAEQ